MLKDQILTAPAIAERSSWWRDLSLHLENEGIRFRQIGQELPAASRSSEVDIVTPVEHLSDVPSSIVRFCRARGLRLLGVDQPAQGTFRFVLGDCSDEGSLTCMYLSATSHLFAGARQCVDAETLLGNTDSAGAVFAYHVISSATFGTLSPARFDVLQKQIHVDRENVLDWINRIWDDSTVSDVVRMVESADFHGFTGMLPRLLTTAKVQGRRSWNAALHEVRLMGRRIRHRSGVFIAILGPDGSGKTSVIDGLTRELEDTMPATLQVHFRPRFGALQRATQASRNPHGRAPRGLARSLLKVAFYATDEIIGYLAFIRPRLVRNEMVIFDRYFHDLLVDPIRYRYGGPMWLTRLLDRLVPSPDLLLVMDAPASVIQARVREVAPEETRRQSVAYRDLRRRYGTVRLVDAARDPREVACQARAFVIDYLEQVASDRIDRFTRNGNVAARQNTQIALAA